MESMSEEHRCRVCEDLYGAGLDPFTLLHQPRMRLRRSRKLDQRAAQHLHPELTPSLVVLGMQGEQGPVSRSASSLPIALITRSALQASILTQLLLQCAKHVPLQQGW